MRLPIVSTKPQSIVAPFRGLLAVSLAAALSGPCAAAEESAGDWKAFTDNIDSTTPIPLGTAEARAQGSWHGIWDGTKRIWNEGSQDFYVSGYYYHTPYGFSSSKRDEYNNNAWGGGYGRTLTDDNDNQRMLYGIAALCVAGLSLAGRVQALWPNAVVFGVHTLLAIAAVLFATFFRVGRLF